MATIGILAGTDSRMNSMRYDNLLRAIERASARYEAEIQQILQRFSKSDEATTQRIVASIRQPKPKKARKAYVRKKLHWTQRPENKARLQKQLKRAVKAKQAAKQAANGSS